MLFLPNGTLLQSLKPGLFFTKFFTKPDVTCWTLVWQSQQDCLHRKFTLQFAHTELWRYRGSMIVQKDDFVLVHLRKFFIPSGLWGYRDNVIYELGSQVGCALGCWGQFTSETYTAWTVKRSRDFCFTTTRWKQRSQSE